MNKKNKIFLLLIALFLLFNIYVFYNINIAYNWNKLYLSKNYLESIDKYNNFLDNKLFLSNNVKSKILHNIWNSYYRLGELAELWDKKLYFWYSIKSYEKSLSIRYDEKTKFNYDFVKNKLDDLNNNQQQNNNQDNNSWENSDKNNWNSNSWNNSSSNWENKNNNSEDSSNSNTTNNNDKLSSEESEFLEKYIDWLNQDQEYYNSFYNKNYKQNDDIFDMFMSDSIFDNSLLNQNNTKDW